MNTAIRTAPTFGSPNPPGPVTWASALGAGSASASASTMHTTTWWRSAPAGREASSAAYAELSALPFPVRASGLRRQPRLIRSWPRKCQSYPLGSPGGSGLRIACGTRMVAR